MIFRGKNIFVQRKRKIFQANFANFFKPVRLKNKITKMFFLYRVINPYYVIIFPNDVNILIISINCCNQPLENNIVKVTYLRKQNNFIIF